MTQTQPFRTESRTHEWASPGQGDLAALAGLAMTVRNRRRAPQ